MRKLLVLITLTVMLTGCCSAKSCKADAVTLPACSKPAPTSAVGYKSLIDSIDPVVWGSGDTGLTVALPGRSVWLFSDTAYAKPGTTYNTPANWAKFDHSSAITQIKGCLHASPWQVMPNDSVLNTYYWVDSAQPLNDTQITVIGFEMRNQPDWTTAATGKFRKALVNVNPNGNVSFSKWLGYVDPPAHPLVKDGGTMGNSVSYYGKVIIDPILAPGSDAYTYSPELHPELKLSSGKTLLSLAVGWSTITPTWQQSRLIFREVVI